VKMKEAVYTGRFWTAHLTGEIRSPLVLYYNDMDNISEIGIEAIKEVIDIANKVFAKFNIDFIDYMVSDEEEGIVRIFPITAKMETLHWDIVVMLDLVIANPFVSFDWEVGIPAEVKVELDEALVQCNPNNLEVSITLPFIKSGVKLTSGLH